MNSKRLKIIASLIENTDYVIDIGTDHAYLPIYLIKNQITSNVICSDISDLVIVRARDNIKKFNLNIDVIKSDGLKNITNNEINTMIIAGMGTHTIINILKDINKFNINKLILSSNNNLPMLRKYLQDINYKIVEEMSVFDKSKWYIIIKAIKGNGLLSHKEQLIGVFNKNNYEYYRYLLTKYLKLEQYKSKEIEYLKEYLNEL